MIWKENAATSRLCPACGLCCNGVLFADVELRPGDHAARLAALGLALEREGRKVRFAQPCSCFDGKLCRIYGDHPARCRTFECGLLQRVQSEELAPASALETIGRARRQARAVRRLLRQLGETDERLALTKRYQNVMTQPLDLSGDAGAVERRGKLMRAMDALMRTLHAEFLS